MWSSLYFISVLIFHAQAFERNPSVAVALSKNGLQFFSTIGHRIVDHEIPKIDFPNISLPIDGGPGSGNVYAYNLKLQKFKSPTFKFALSPPSSITWQSDNGYIKLSGRWKADYTVLATLHLNGWVEVITKGIRSTLSLGAFGQDGHPQIEVHTCDADILELHMSLGGGVIQWIVNLFKEDLSYAVKSAINQQLCNTLRTVVLDQANAALRTLPKHVDIASNIYLDYELEEKPVQVTETHIVGRTYVDIMLGDQTCKLPTPSIKINQINETFMANIWITEAVPNCLLASAHNSNLLHFILNRDIVIQLDTFLSTSCKWYDICIGKFFPKLTQDYPNRHIQMNFYSAKEPAISLLEGSVAQVLADFHIDWQIQPEDGKKNVNDTLARLDMRLVAGVEPVIYNQHLCGRINSTKVTFTEVFSKIGDISQSFLDTFDVILNPIIRVSADATLRMGILIPLVENITIANQTELSIESGAVRINADFVYVTSILQYP